ncbi:hypothetical protein [Moraxella canis]|uniref:Uncharacterized protein n=1 Tax=Moraxella canis TaxID=90239 RepID=A0A1S9ZJF8_9GAMM|nr:hypothetical protein [Moraxella canis]OOR83171.1 hypothetical protein B0180_06230 [Moraxella canis]
MVDTYIYEDPNWTNWHHALFPQEVSGMYDINVGALRDDTNDPMQLISGANGKAKGHFNTTG